MKAFFSFLLVLFAYSLQAAPDTTAKSNTPLHPTYVSHGLTATAAIGFFDANRYNYTIPSGFIKNNTSGFAPILAKLEYGLNNNVSLAATFCYDAFNYNFSQRYIGNNGPFIRYRTDAFRLASGGLTAYYHLGKYIRVKHLDPFIGVGVSLNNTRHSALAEGDSTTIRFDHMLTPYLKVGARYYISDKFSIFGDLGYDKPCLVSIGFSSRFFIKKKMTNRKDG